MKESPAQKGLFPMKNEELKILPEAVASDKDLISETEYDRCASTIIDNPEITTGDQLNLMEASGSLDFWMEAAEDMYEESE